jgi:hypothetical protein
MKWRQFATNLLQQFLSAIAGSATDATAGKVTEKLGPKDPGKKPTRPT